MLYPSNALSILNIVKHRTKNITCLVCDVKERVRAWHYTDTDTTFQHYAPLHHLPLIIKHKYKHKLIDKKGWTQRVGLANILLAKGLVANILLDA